MLLGDQFNRVAPLALTDRAAGQASVVIDDGRLAVSMANAVSFSLPVIVTPLADLTDTVGNGPFVIDYSAAYSGATAVSLFDVPEDSGVTIDTGAETITVPDAAVLGAVTVQVANAGGSVFDEFNVDISVPNAAPAVTDTAIVLTLPEGTAAAPQLSSSVPANNATGVAVDAHLFAVFDQPVEFGPSKTIVLYDVTADAVKEPFDTTDDIGSGNGQVSIASATLRINPTGNLPEGHEFAILWEGGSVASLTGMPVAALTDTGTLSFTTVSAGVAPENTVAPALSGTATVGQDLSSTSGTWTGDPTITFAYQWQRSDNGSTGWADISGATANSYTLVAGDATKYVRCVVTATNGAGSDSASSAASDQIAAAGGSPAFVGTHNSGQTGSNTTTHPINMPAGIVAGERLLVLFSVDGNPTISINTGVSGANWARLGQFSSGAQTYDVFTKIAEGSDALTLTTSVSEQSGHISQRIENATNIEFSAGANSGGAKAANADPDSLSPASGSREYRFVAIMGAEVGCAISAAPTNYGGLIAETGSGTSGSVAMAHRLLTAATEDPGAFTSSNSRWGAVTAAIWN